MRRYDARFERLTQYAGDVRVVGFFQSWKYFRDVRACVVREFTFRAHIQTTADDFLRRVADDYQYVVTRWKRSFSIYWYYTVLFCFSAILDPRVGHTIDVGLLSPFISVLCHSD